MTDTDRAAPTAASERYELVDALRGFALCGVLLANLSSFSLYDYAATQARGALPSAAFDAGTEVAFTWLLTHKAVTVFSILFGFGFAMQLERAEARGDGLRVFLRRMAVLLALGLLHSAFWWGDILLIYAIGGLLLPLVRRWNDRWLLIGGFALALVATAWLSPQLMGPEAAVERQRAFAVALRGLSAPSLADAFAANAELLRMWYPIGGLWLVCFALGRFMLGYWAGRRGLLQRPASHLPLLKRILGWTLPLGLLATLLRSQRAVLVEAWPALGPEHHPVAWATIAYAGPLLLGIAFGTIFVLLYLRDGWKRWLRHFAPAGRMALTNYLMQTAICSAIFYGYGLGIGYRYGAIGWFAVWLPLFAAQMAFSRWWLARYRFGPMEWLWRTLTYGRLQPMRLRAASRAA